jgi:hypothetical protein
MRSATKAGMAYAMAVKRLNHIANSGGLAKIMAPSLAF